MRSLFAVPRARMMHLARKTLLWTGRMLYVLMPLALLSGFVFWLFNWQASGDTTNRYTHAWPKTDFSRRSVDFSEILSGGPPKDGIPSLDAPRFVTPAQASSWLSANEPLLLVVHGGVARGYPFQILIWHEIVNDVVAGLPVAVTFCPLCNSALVFDRRVGGRTLEFGVSGLLRNSDMIMWDRQTESWWQQLTGTGIVGQYNGKKLRQLSAPVTTFRFFREHFPKGQVLSRQTGHQRPYGENPYRGYDSIANTQPFLLRGQPDGRLHPVEHILAVEVGSHARVYPYTVLRQVGVVNERVGSQDVVVFFQPDATSALDQVSIAASKQAGAATAWLRRLADGRLLSFEVLPPAAGSSRGWRDTLTSSKWNFLGQAIAGPLKGQRLKAAAYGSHFAFAWLAFRPKSTIYTR